MIGLLYLVVLFFSVIIHEVSHGYAAKALGDDTAYYSGRLTLNPAPHIDLFGTIILPLILYLVGSPFLIGWAKPVPVNPYNFVNPRQDFAKVAAAGPLSNIALALISTAAIALLRISGMTFTFSLIVKLLQYAIFINILLAVFNLVPVPPLDGSRILSAILPYDKAYKYERIVRIGPFFTLILLWVFWPIIFRIVEFLTALLLGLAMAA